MNQRQSNFELIRLIAIFLIATMHAMGQVFDTTNFINKEIIIFINSIANTGVSLFILISGYFGIKFRIERLYGIIGTTLFYSLFQFCIDYLFLDVHFKAKDFIPIIFPISGRHWWFISCYTVIYCLSPYINLIVEKLNRNDFRKLLFILLVFFFIAPTVLVFHEINNDLGKGVVTMFIIYLIGRYIRIYGMPTIIQEHSISIIIWCTIFIFIMNSVLSTQGNIILRFARDNGILILLSSLSIFNITSRIHFYSTIINSLASFVFGIYLCHFTIIKIFQPIYIEHKNDLSLWWRLLVVLSLAYSGSIIIDYIRSKTILLINNYVNNRKI